METKLPQRWINDITFESNFSPLDEVHRPYVTAIRFQIDSEKPLDPNQIIEVRANSPCELCSFSWFRISDDSFEAFHRVIRTTLLDVSLTLDRVEFKFSEETIHIDLRYQEAEGSIGYCPSISVDLLPTHRANNLAFWEASNPN